MTWAFEREIPEEMKKEIKLLKRFEQKTVRSSSSETITIRAYTFFLRHVKMASGFYSPYRIRAV